MIQNISIQKTNFSLETPDGVFGLSEHGNFLAQHITINKGESVADIGTGSGIFAVYASLKKAKSVFATDIIPEYITSTTANADLNAVTIETELVNAQDFFGSSQEKYDVIIANLPQKWLAESNNTDVSGGKRGNEVVKLFSEQARQHCKTNTRIYMLLYTLTDFKETLDTYKENYSVKILANGFFQEDKLITDNFNFYQSLREQGVIMFAKQNNKLGAFEFVIELNPLF